MKLEKIILNGFKSFADKTEFHFDAGITAIVGPNGCGKSNVVDAVKWVLGEQSAKSLRSGQMLDVIFSGSGSRKAGSMAQVSLFFSDVNGIAGREGEQLQITRRLYRSGDSEYLINNKVSRLRDIRELFMDTGVGTKAYSIIEQGQVDQLLVANKYDRRALFEEAAGVSKYKAHKKQAERKLERTEQNLLRLADIVAEVQKQLRSVKLQAGKARNYLEYSERLKNLRVSYSLSEYHQIKINSDSKRQQLADKESVFGSHVAEVGRLDALLSELTSSIFETENQINQTDNTLISVKSKIEQQRERIGFLRHRIDELTERKSTSAEQIKNLTEQKKTFAAQIEVSQKQLDNSEDEYQAANEKIESISSIIHEINLNTHNIEAELADEKSGIIDIVRRTAQLHNEIQSVNTYRDNLSGQKDRLHGRASAAESELQQLLTEKARVQARLGDIDGLLDELNTSLNEKRQQLEDTNAAAAELSDRLSGLKEDRSGMQSELKVLTDMEAKKEGVTGSVRKILKAKNEEPEKYSYVEGIVADLISSDVEHAVAVEAALGNMAEAIVINSTGQFLDDQQMRDQLEGRVRVLCADRVEPFTDSTDLRNEPGVIGRLVEFVNFESRFSALLWKLLAKTVLVESIQSAMDLTPRLGGEFQFVTLTGEVLNNGHLLSVGPLGKAEGLISRKSRLKKLQSDLAALSVGISKITEELENNHLQSERLSKLCQNLRTSVYEANTEKTEAKSSLSAVEQNVKRLTEEQPLIKNEIEMLEQQIEKSVKTEYENKQKLSELEEVNKQRSQRVDELQNSLEEQKQMLSSHSEQLTEMKVALGQIVEQRKARKAEISGLQSQIQHTRMSLESARNEQLNCEQQLTQTERNILTSEAAVSELYMEKDKAQQKSTELHRRVEEIIAEQKHTENTLREKRSEQTALEEQIHKLKMSLSQFDVRREDMVQRIREELGIDLIEAYQNYEEQQTDWDAVREEISELRGKIERLGNVNVDAIEEQQSLEERNEFLSGQVEDLNKSKTQLQQLITKINRESKEKFRVTFEEIRENFQLIFRKLFGGGKADIILENPEDLLESGIEIVARPPGKETRSISLLSGGEKTMTAIALLFAVFKSKPSPFCFLDEVDAALDEANNERFNMIVKEFEEDSQFVIVTHSKRTMSIADILFGVTMQTQGVSKKISVKFDQAEESAVA